MPFTAIHILFVHIFILFYGAIKVIKKNLFKLLHTICCERQAVLTAYKSSPCETRYSATNMSDLQAHVGGV